jgi:hypothetical protein
MILNDVGQEPLLDIGGKNSDYLIFGEESTILIPSSPV